MSNLLNVTAAAAMLVAGEDHGSSNPILLAV